MLIDRSDAMRTHVFFAASVALQTSDHGPASTMMVMPWMQQPKPRVKELESQTYAL